ncbi:hypothetical protein AeMF1_004594 [Aphanomyces euteiches]|nr:hypothetical protein AeMF1_004594 [Aphanomyces euteiches]
MSNVRVKFLPPNTTSHIQPLDAGIIRNFKLKYKTHFVQWLLDQISVGDNEKKLDVLSAIHMVVRAWCEVTPETIRHCWCHTRIVSGPTAALLKQHDEPRKSADLSSLANAMKKLSLVDCMEVEEYLTCDDELEEWSPEADTEQTCANDCHEEQEDDSENIPMTHREALNAAIQLETYTFVHNLDVPGLQILTEKVRQQLVGSMRQRHITNYFALE